jgi:hypothetical protein
MLLQVVSSADILESPTFVSVSVTANRWLPIDVVPRGRPLLECALAQPHRFMA